MTVKKSFGFGFNPSETHVHFMVTIPVNETGDVLFYERSRWSAARVQTIISKKDKAKASLPYAKWNKISGALSNEFNRRLKKKKIVPGEWTAPQVPVERMLGKEMMVLVWAVEDADPALIPTAIRNWLGFSPEERWWLFTITNAMSGNLGERRGWRKALRFAFTENPVDESKDIERFELPSSSKKRKINKTNEDDDTQPGLF